MGGPLVGGGPVVAALVGGAAVVQRVPPLPKSATGCARTDGYIKRSSAYKFEHSMYFRGFINRGELPAHKRPQQEQSEVMQEALGERAQALNLRRRDGSEVPKTAPQLAMRAGGVAAMLKEVARTSQVVAISHHKEFHELADHMVHLSKASDHTVVR